MRFSAERTTHRGYAAIRLADAEAALEVEFLPGLGMIGASLRHRGDELLGRTENLERYAREGSTLGIPLLHPWANRLGGAGYEALGVAVDLDSRSPLLHLDGNGLPIHGVPGHALAWRVAGAVADDRGARLRAVLDFTSEPLLRVFPFPHLLEIAATLDADGLTIATELAPAADTGVPVSFGYHPYVGLPGVPRSSLRVELPPMQRLVLDPDGIPTGAEEPFPGLASPIDRAYDDAFGGLPSPCRFALEGAGRRVEIRFIEGYAYAQVFAPEDADFVCFEPMTAPPNALRSGLGLRVVEPGKRFRAAFRIAVATHSL